MLKDSHLLEPPPRTEEFQIEWYCIDCGIKGTASASKNLHARELFSRMYKNHQARVTTQNPIYPFKVYCSCPHPTFKWARVK